MDYIAHKIDASIEIDGNIEKEVWKKANWSNRFVDMVTGEPGMYNTQTSILWNDLHLYIAFKVEEEFVGHLQDMTYPDLKQQCRFKAR